MFQPQPLLNYSNEDIPKKSHLWASVRDKRGESFVLPCKNLIRPLSFLGKLVNKQGIVCNIYLQRVSFCRYLGGHPKGLARGSKRSQGWFYFTKGGQSNDPIQRAVLVESPIDAMSIAVLERTESRKTIYLSTDGAGHVPVEFLRTLPTQSVIVAYDNDAVGQEMATSVMNLLPNAGSKQPNAKDWNEDLKNMFDFASRQSEISKQQQQNQKRHRGLSR